MNQLSELSKLELAKDNVVAQFRPNAEVQDGTKPKKAMKVKPAKPLGASSDLVQNKAVRSKAKRVFAKAKVTDPSEKSIDRYIEGMLAKKLDPRTQSCRPLAKEIGKC